MQGGQWNNILEGWIHILGRVQSGKYSNKQSNKFAPILYTAQLILKHYRAWKTGLETYATRMETPWMQPLNRAKYRDMEFSGESSSAISVNLMSRVDNFVHPKNAKLRPTG